MKTTEDAAVEAPAGRPLPFGLMAGLLVLIGAGLRIWGIGDHDLWLDEYGTAWVVAGDSWAEVFDRAWEIQGQSPLPYLVMRLSVDLFGEAWWSLRLPSLLFGVGLLILAWPLGRVLLGHPRAALAALAVMAVEGTLISFSQDARPYSLALFGAGLSAYGLARWLDTGNRRAATWWVLGSVLCWYGHYVFAPLFLAQGLFLVLRLRRDRALVGPASRLVALHGLLFLPGLVHFGTLLGRRSQLDWVPRDGGPLEALANCLSGLFPPGAMMVAGGAAVLIAWRFGSRKIGEDRGALFVATWALLPPAVALVLPLLLDINLLHPRYVSVAIPGACLLIAGLLALPRREHLVTLLPIVLWITVAVLGWLMPAWEQGGLFSFRFVDQRWREAVRSVADEWREGDVLLHRSAFVELDAIARGEGEGLEGFVDWPIRANFPEHRGEFLRLPFSRPVFDKTGWGPERLPPGCRVWVIGRGRDLLDRLVEMVAEDPTRELDREEQFGSIVVLLVRPVEGSPR